MKRVLTVSCVLTFSLFGQFRENVTPDLKCNSSNQWYKGYSNFCDLRESKLPVTQRLDIDAAPNGGVSVRGWNRNEVWVRARVEAHTKDGGDVAAKTLASQVTIEASAGRIAAKGPKMSNGDHWSVTFEVFTPHRIDVGARTMNGGLNANDIEGQLRFSTLNGGLNLTRVAGDVQGRSTNGGVNVDLEGARWEGAGLDVSTTNGGVTMHVPAAYSAHLRASTTNGGFTSDFGTPAKEQGRGRKEYERILGNGGSPVVVKTTNGGVRIQKK
jgi:DUF4097 and DUF4098 domain-containing protein YvlB